MESDFIVPSFTFIIYLYNMYVAYTKNNEMSEHINFHLMTV